VIRINLLPADLRRGNRVPTKVLAAAFAAALAVSGAIGWFGLVYFGDLGTAEQQLVEVEARLAEQSKKAAYHDQLDANKKDYALRVQTIQGISKSRRVWSRFLDELIDVANNNGDTDRHLAWFDGITMKNDPKKGALVQMPASVQDSDKSRLANFHDDIEAAPFAKELLSKSDPVYKIEKDKVRIPESSMAFRLELQFKPTVVEPPKAKPKPATPPAAPAGK
jgi:hypothetical protein